jgi:hypothetical protein
MDKIPFCSQPSDYSNYSDDDEEEEVLAICPLCQEPKAVGQILKLLIIGNKADHPHMDCVSRIGCDRCKATIGDFTIKDSKLVHVNDQCSPELCYICKFVIGDSETKTIEGFDRSCCKCCVDDKKICYVCDYPTSKLSYRDILICEEDGIRHQKCNPERCTDCKKMFLNSKFRTVFDGKYHDTCGPKCLICNKIKKEDNYTLIYNKQVQGYSHKDCLADPCCICNKDLGDPDSYYKPSKQISFRIHKNCAFKCRQCNLIYPDVDKLPWIGITDMNYRQHAQGTAKRTSLGLYFLQKAKFIKRSDGYKMFMPKDVIEMIIKIILKESFPSIQYLDNCPTRIAGINMNQICNRQRCIVSVCLHCSSKLSWSRNNFSGCSSLNCAKVRKGFNKILRLVFDYDAYETKASSIWPPNIKVGLSFVIDLFIDRCDTLTPEQISLYNGMLNSLKIIDKQING